MTEIESVVDTATTPSDDGFRACHFFVVGAMKAGTTTLHDDLSRHPGLFLPSFKEPGYYCGPEFGGPARLPGRAATRSDYIRLYAKAGNSQIRGDCSTHYAKLPDLPSAAHNIAKDSGPDTRIIYLVRDPVKRAISHFGHDIQHGHCPVQTLAEAIDDYAPMINYSRYAMQLAPYEETFGRSNILVMKFENYIANRLAYARLCVSFIGLDPEDLPDADLERVKNASEDRRRLPGWLRRMRHSAFYHTNVRPLLPGALRKAALSSISSEPASWDWGGEPEDLEARIRAKLDPADLDVFENAV